MAADPTRLSACVCVVVSVLVTIWFDLTELDNIIEVWYLLLICTAAYVSP